MSIRKKQEGHLSKTGVPPKKRPRYTMSEKTIDELAFLHRKNEQRVKSRIYPCDTLAKIIHDAYVIEKTFGGAMHAEQ